MSLHSLLSGSLFPLYLPASKYNRKGDPASRDEFTKNANYALNLCTG